MNEVIRALADGLASTAFGVEYQLANLPVDATDTATPLTVFITEGTRDDYSAKGEIQSRGEEIALFLYPDGPTLSSPHTLHGAELSLSLTPVAIMVVHRGEAQPAQKVADVGYVLRAIVLAMRAYFAQGQVARTRNQITILRPRDVRRGLTTDDGLGAIGAVAFTVESFDKLAQRT